MYSMSNALLSGLLLAFNLLGMMALMMTSKRYRNKFHLKRPLLVAVRSNLLSHHDEQKRYITKQQRLRWLGLLLLLIGFIFPFFAPHTGYFIVVWFASLIVAAGVVYLSMVVYEKLE
ncbi:hypothetical protein CXF58_03900 [Psychrobacter sp. Sarcosine-02u-2]|nr:hypothetical protein CXF58_03900 [Psychrobacter sp. Sarcosine-02u-2]